MNKVERVKKFLFGVPKPSKCEELPRGNKPYFTIKANSWGGTWTATDTIKIPRP